LSSFAFGQGGANIQAFVLTGTYTVIKRVSYLKPIQSTDKLYLELHNGNGWISSDIFTYQYNEAGTVIVGCRINQVNSTDVDVIFHSKASFGDTWASISTYKWRVRKVSNGNMAEVPPVVRAEYKDNVNTMPSGASATFQYNTKIEDTHNAVTTGSNSLEMSARPVTVGGAVTAVNDNMFILYVNSISNKYLILFNPDIGTTYQPIVSSSTTVRLNVGDYLYILWSNGDSVRGYTTQGGIGAITITRIGS